MNVLWVVIIKIDVTRLLDYFSQCVFLSAFYFLDACLKGAKLHKIWKNVLKNWLSSGAAM